jgi:hypothetical protein
MVRDDDHDTTATREAAALIHAFRRRAEPPPDAADRSWAALERRIARGERGPELDAEPHAAPRHGRRWLIAGLAAAALLAAWRLSPRTAAQGGRDGALAAIFAAIEADPPRRAALRGAPTPVRVAPVLRDSSPAPPPPTATPPTATPRADVPKDRHDLARELAEVRAAAEAVRAGDGASGLTRADAYLRAHPGGAFAPEARLHRAEALCLLGRVDEARAAAAAFERDLPSSPLRARVAAVCAER